MKQLDINLVGILFGFGVTRQEDCIREAVFIVSPKKQYRGSFSPTIPATAEPL